MRLDDVRRGRARARGAAGRLDRGGQPPNQRTSVMTHLAWVPADWEEAAERTLAGLAEQHPSRTIMLFPRPDDDDGLDTRRVGAVLRRRRAAVCAEVIRVRLCGERRGIRRASSCRSSSRICRSSAAGAAGPSSTSVRRARRRRRPARSSTPPNGQVTLCHEATGSSRERFDRTAVSDIAWERTERWRREIAAAWPFEGGSSRSRRPARRRYCSRAGSARASATTSSSSTSRRSPHRRVRRRPPVDAPVGEPPPPSRSAVAPARPLHARPDLRGRRPGSRGVVTSRRS